MHKNVVIFSIFFFFALISACKRENPEINTCEPLSVCESSPIDTMLLMKYPYRVKWCDSVLIILDLHAPLDYYIHLFSYPQMRFITSICKVGNGPEEFVSVSTFDVAHDTLYVMDAHKKVMHLYPLEELNAFSQERTVQTIHYQIDYAPILNWSVTSRGIRYVENSIARKMIEVDSVGNQISIDSLTVIDAEKKGIPDLYYPSLWNSFMDYDEANNTTVVATQLGEQLEIIREKHLKTIIGKGGSPDVVRMGRSISMGKIDGYCDVKIYNGNIYALFSGADREESMKLLQEDKYVPNGANRLRIYDFEGNLQKELQLSEYVNGFDIDTIGEKLITVNSNSENIIVLYDLASILN